MADLKIAKASVETALQTNTREAGAKTRPSKFDDIRLRLTEEVASRVNMPPVVTVSRQQRISLESALRQRLAATDASQPSQIFVADTNNITRNLEKLRRTVEMLPTGSAVNPIRVRLNVLEQQFKQSGALIRRVSGMDPQSLLKVQVQMYELTQNIELLSKVVDQVSSGVKTILQTQVG